jgi:hypothetical protein
MRSFGRSDHFLGQPAPYLSSLCKIQQPIGCFWVTSMHFWASKS